MHGLVARRMAGIVQVFGRRQRGALRMLRPPASKKRRGTKSREVGRRRSSECFEVRFEVLDLGNSKSGGLETRGRVKRFGTIVAKQGI